VAVPNHEQQRRSGDDSSDGARKHRKLVTGALASNAVKLLRKYHDRVIDIFSFEGPGQRSDKTIFGAAELGVLRLLHELGGDLNAVDTEGRTPAYYAAAMGHVEAIRALCELGADITTPDDNGRTITSWGAIIWSRVCHGDSEEIWTLTTTRIRDAAILLPWPNPNNVKRIR
jgi:hypothetical protein